MPIKNYTPAEALDEQNRVQIALWNGKIFQAGIVDVMEGGERLHVVRIHKGRVIRKEVLKIGYGYGNVRAVSTSQCRHLLKGIGNDEVLPPLGNKKLVKSKKEKISNTKWNMIQKTPSTEFLEFKKQNDQFLKEREKDLKIMNQKILRFEEVQRLSNGVRADLWTLGQKQMEVMV